jgi:hypothetical protein
MEREIILVLFISFIVRKEIFFLITYFAFTELSDDIGSPQSVRTSFLIWITLFWVLTVCGLERS